MKQKRYWLRFGLSFAFAGAMFFVVLQLIERGPLGFLAAGIFDGFGFMFAMFMMVPYLYVSRLLGYDAWNGEHVFSDPTLQNIFYIFITIFPWFAVGAMIGWFYGIIKNKNNVNSK